MPLFASMAAVPQREQSPHLEQLYAALSDRSRSILVCVAHPDDEAIAVGGHLAGWPFARLIHVTDGAPRDPSFALAAGYPDPATYARVRADELDRALEVVGVTRSRSIRLGRPDQESCFDLQNLTCELVNCLESLKPDVLITHSYEGGHPDHDATAFAAQAACYLGARRGLRTPMRVEVPFYHRSRAGVTYAEFPSGGPTSYLKLQLDDRQRRDKQAMLDCYVSQRGVLAPFPRATETFRIASAYDFTLPPHGGQLHYESLGWRVTGPVWRRLAKEALQALDIQPHAAGREPRSHA